MVERKQPNLIERFLLGDGAGPWAPGVRGAQVGEQKMLTSVSPVYNNNFDAAYYTGAIDYHREAGAYSDNAIVMACVNWISRNFGTAPLTVYRKTADGQERLPEHPLVLRLLRPNEYYAGSLLWPPTLLDYNTTGNAYWLKLRNGAGRLIGLQYWSQENIFAVSEGDDFITRYRILVRNAWEDRPLTDVVHFRNGLRPDDPRYGLSPLHAAEREIYTDNEAGRYAATILRNMGVPGAIITPEGDYQITAEGADIIKRQYQAKFTGDRRGEAMVMPGPIKIIQPAFSPTDMDADGLREKPEERICALLGLSPMVVGVGAGLARSTYSNMEEAYRAAYRNNLIPTQAALADVLDIQLLPEFSNRADESVGFDYDDVTELQESHDAIATRAALLFDKGIVTLNEARGMIGQDPLPGGDELKKPAAPPPMLPPPAPEPETVVEVEPVKMLVVNGNGRH